MDHWRKIKDWRQSLKSLLRGVGHASSGGGKNKAQRLKEAAEKYISKSKLLLHKLIINIGFLPLRDETDLLLYYELKHYMRLLEKHIDLVERRLVKGEKIPHEEKMFSIFETYTEWINKGKSRPSVELGKKFAITTDQWGLIVDYHVMAHEQDRDIVISVADRVLAKHQVCSWSFDKGFWNAENRELLGLYIKDVIMPKLGKLSGKDAELEKSPTFICLKNKHSAVESNINELEHRGLDRCPDRGEKHFRVYAALGVCAYNLKKLGRAILNRQLAAEKPGKAAA